MSTTKEEYVALSHAMGELIPCHDLLAEITKLVRLPITDPTLQFTVFEDNRGTIELAKLPRMRSPTKRINIKYHHFRDHIQHNKIKINKV